MFIAIYGVNNIGKSTHAKRLASNLEKAGRKVKYVKYPVYGIETGKRLNKILRGGEQKVSEEELQQLFVDNRIEFEPTLKSWIKEGYDVVAEDYVGTGIGWGLAKGLDLELLERINEDLLKADFTLLIDGERAKSAVESGHIHEEHDDLIKRARDSFLLLADRYEWEVVPLQDEKDDTEKLVWETVEKYM